MTFNSEAVRIGSDRDRFHFATSKMKTALKRALSAPTRAVAREVHVQVSGASKIKTVPQHPLVPKENSPS